MTMAALLISLDNSTPPESRLSLRVHPANLRSLCSHCRKGSDTETPTHGQAANPPRHEEHRPTYQVGSSYMLAAKQSYLANTICVYLINFCPGKIVQILCSSMRKQISGNLEKNTLTFKRSGCLSDFMTLRSSMWIPKSTFPAAPWRRAWVGF